MGELRFDVTVLGAGVFGLSVAWACIKRGARVQVIDPGGVAAGSSGGIVGALAPHTPENWNEKKQFQLESLLMAECYWAEVAEVSGRDPGHARLGRVQPVADDHALALALARGEGAKALWKGQAEWRVEEGCEKWAPISPSGKWIFDSLSARIHPRRACEALAGAIEARGGYVTRVSDLSGVIVHATGYQGLLELSEVLGQPVGNGVKGQALLLDYDARGLPQLFADGVHFVPHGDGTLAIGSTSERDWEAPASTDTQLETLRERAVASVPLLAGVEVIARWAGVRPRARSRAPMLGAHPTRPGEFIANGGFKIGFGMAPMISEVMADLVLDGRNRVPAGFEVEASLREG